MSYNTPTARLIDALGRAITSTPAPVGLRRRLALCLERSASNADQPPGEAARFARPPVCDCLAKALEVAREVSGPIRELADAIAALDPQIVWRRRDPGRGDDPAFADGHANAFLVGDGWPAIGDDVVIGASLLASNITYPRHRHPPEELYIVLSGGEWYRESRGWYAPGAGAHVHHEPGVVHAMRSGDEPLIALWCLWRDQ